MRCGTLAQLVWLRKGYRSRRLAIISDIAVPKLRVSTRRSIWLDCARWQHSISENCHEAHGYGQRLYRLQTLARSALSVGRQGAPVLLPSHGRHRRRRSQPGLCSGIYRRIRGGHRALGAEVSDPWTPISPASASTMPGTTPDAIASRSWANAICGLVAKA